MRGKAKGVADHMKDGTFRADRHGDRVDHLAFGGDIGEPEEWLSELAKKRWREVVSSMPVDCLRRSDRGVLTIHCVQFAKWQEIESWLEMKSIDDSDHYKIQMEAIMLFSKVYETMQRLGLTPVDRIKLRAPTSTENESPQGLSRLKLVTAENA